MDPTTMPVSTGSESFWVDGDVDEPAVAAGAVDDAMATSLQKGSDKSRNRNKFRRRHLKAPKRTQAL
jgi:hypothetical protein